MSPVAPEAVPGARLLRVAEELDFHLLEFARAKGEVARRDFIAKALADLGNAKGDADTACVHHIAEVHENSLCRFRTQKRGILLASQGTDNGLEHQVELAG